MKAQDRGGVSKFSTSVSLEGRHVAGVASAVTSQQEGPAFVGFLQVIRLPLTMQTHANLVNWQLEIVQRCECGWSLCLGPGILSRVYSTFPPRQLAVVPEPASLSADKL